MNNNVVCVSRIVTSRKKFKAKAAAGLHNCFEERNILYGTLLWNLLDNSAPSFSWFHSRLDRHFHSKRFTCFGIRRTQCQERPCRRKTIILCRRYSGRDKKGVNFFWPLGSACQLRPIHATHVLQHTKKTPYKISRNNFSILKTYFCFRHYLSSSPCKYVDFATNIEHALSEWLASGRTNCSLVRRFQILKLQLTNTKQWASTQR